ncbi:phosphatase PAP2 family protein [Candidatus Chloroploca sp. M-50]|uniref:Phosphatase PAP2 family protein n=1 Tax=Candidatus Chloroploca mongolica TaxID=2528176 RepID=A0ABS4DCB2_9CHLR|nr:diacylglycerol kinase family protein [Candidatus Chloroploca mongolica]MBP1467079.1 phosphatase PAP2 family protein [Candidatus Chloroploca mongolica]
MHSTQQRATNIFVVLNPVAGTSDPEMVRAALEQRLGSAGRQLAIYTTTGADGEDISGRVREAVAGGCDLVVAAGGDGTVAAVAGALAGSNVPLGIVPVGTANVLVQVLALPLELEPAIDLLAEDLRIVALDGMRLGDQLGLLHISVGLTSLMQRDTSREAKRRFGRLAYFYVAARWAFGMQPQRFMLVIDGVRYRVSASQVLVANGGDMGQPPFSWGTEIVPDDGVIDVCIITARTLRDYLKVGWATLTGRQHSIQQMRYFKARQSVAINMKSKRQRMPVQLDGELAGTTPIKITVEPRAVRCVVGSGFVAHDVAPQPTLTTPLTPEGALLDEPVDAEVAARMAPLIDALREQLAQIVGPEQARQVVDTLIRLAADRTAPSVGQTVDAVEAPQLAAQIAGSHDADAIADALLAVAAQIEAREGMSREALEQAARRATNPQVTERDPKLASSLSLLRAELIEQMGPYHALDSRLFVMVNQMPHPPLLNRFMYGLTQVMNGGWGWILILLGATAIDRERGLQALRQVAPPMWLSTMTIEYPVKSYFRRQRPFLDVVQAVVIGRKPGSYSFPSGHSAAAFAGAWLMSRHYPELRPAWYLLAATVSFSRVYLGVHYPGDVIIGAAAGTALAEATRRLIDYS